MACGFFIFHKDIMQAIRSILAALPGVGAIPLMFATALLLTHCGAEKAPKAAPDTEKPSRVVVEEAWQSERNEADNVDSPAFWAGVGGERWVIATAKSSDRLLVYDATTGAFIRGVGSTGAGNGQMRRPNGIATVDNMAIVVERDNHRVQVFRLPDWKPLGFFGQNDLVKPYGIAVVRDGKDFLLYVTDNYERPDESIPPDAELGARVKMFRMSVRGTNASGTLLRAFGETSGDGVLHIVESICADTVHGRLLIADEDARYNDIKVYDLEGTFTGELVGKGLFKAQPEGIVLYECNDGGGYWVMTDQDHANNTFMVFDRKDFALLGTFTGASTTNTDGIALTQLGFGPFVAGCFFAVHNDGNVTALDWGTVAGLLKLEKECTQRMP